MTWIIVGITLATLGFFWVRAEIFQPWRRVRRLLHELASGDLHPTPVLDGLPVFRGLGSDIERVAERLREMNRVASDEGFSLRAILGAMQEGVLIVDGSHRIRLVNPALSKLFAFRTSPMDRTLMEVFRQHALDEAVRECLSAGEPIHREFDFPVESAQGGSRRYVEANIAPMPGWQPGKPTGAIAVFHDLTELKTLESLRHDLVANVSHELRTPLAIIHGYLETLLDGALDDRETAERFLKVMHRHGVRLNRLIEDLSSLSHLESGRGMLEFEPVDLAGLIDEVASRFEGEIATRRATLSVSVPPGFPLIEGDANRLDQVLFNLCENAFKYSGSSPLSLRISVEEWNGRARVEVADNGPGIPLSDHQRLFERFYRVHKDRNRDAGGTGLGLSIVKHVVLAHGGEVGLESQPGEGTTFWFTIPFEQTPEGTEAPIGGDLGGPRS